MEKEEIKEAIYYHHYASIKAEMCPNGQVMNKLRGLVDRDLTSPQDYLKSSCLAEARMAARVQLNMVRCPGNMAGLYRGRMSCEACAPWREEGEVGPVQTQEHMTVCPAYRFLQQQYGDRMSLPLLYGPDVGAGITENSSLGRLFCTLLYLR